MEFARVSITISGYAVVPGKTNEEILENTKKLGKTDFDWEPVTLDVLEDASIIEACGPNGESL